MNTNSTLLNLAKAQKYELETKLSEVLFVAKALHKTNFTIYFRVIKDKVHVELKENKEAIKFVDVTKADMKTLMEETDINKLIKKVMKVSELLCFMGIRNLENALYS